MLWMEALSFRALISIAVILFFILYGGKAVFLQHRSGGGISFPGYMEGAVIAAGSVAKRI